MKSERVRVQFLEALHFPRFSMRYGETWEVRKEKVTIKGFPIGGGFCKSNQYRVIG